MPRDLAMAMTTEFLLGVIGSPYSVGEMEGIGVIGGGMP